MSNDVKSTQTKTKPNAIMEALKKDIMSQKAPNQDELPLNDEKRAQVQAMLEQQLVMKAFNDLELEVRLETCGKLTRAMNASVSKSGEVKMKPVSEVQAAKIMLSLAYVKIIGEYLSDTTPVMIYNLQTGIWEENNRRIRKLINIIEPQFSQRNEDRVMKLIWQNCEFTKPTHDSNIAVLGNGIFNIETKEFEPFSAYPDFVDKYTFLTKSDVNYNPEAKCPTFPDGWTFDGFLDEQFGDDEDSKFGMYQLLQYALLNNKPKKTFTYLYSVEGRTGKGTFTELLVNLVGVNNAGSANIAQIEKPFGLEGVYNKALIYGNENDDVIAKSNDNIKNLATGDRLTVTRKGLVNLTVQATPLIVQSMNSTPQFEGLDSALKNRMRVFKFNHSYYDDDNEDVKEKYIKDQSLLEFLAFKVLNMPVADIIDTDASKNVKMSIEIDSNPITEWFTERFDMFESDILPIQLLFADFLVFLSNAGINQKFTRRKFVTHLTALTTKDYDYTRVRYEKIESEDFKNDLNMVFETAKTSKLRDQYIKKEYIVDKQSRHYVIIKH